MVYVLQVCWQLASGIRMIRSVPSWSRSQILWHIPMLCVQWKTPDDEQRNCPGHVEFYSKNKFEKLFHLFGFIIRIYHDARSPELQINHINFHHTTLYLSSKLQYVPLNTSFRYPPKLKFTRTYISWTWRALSASSSSYSPASRVCFEVAHDISIEMWGIPILLTVNLFPRTLQLAVPLQNYLALLVREAVHRHIVLQTVNSTR